MASLDVGSACGATIPANWPIQHDRAPGFVVTAITIASLGIGAAATVFTITDQVLLHPLLFTETDRLVELWENVPQYARMELSPANDRDGESRSTSFDTFAAHYFSPVNLVGEGEPQRLRRLAVADELFPCCNLHHACKSRGRKEKQ